MYRRGGFICGIKARVTHHARVAGHQLSRAIRKKVDPKNPMAQTMDSSVWRFAGRGLGWIILHSLRSDQSLLFLGTFLNCDRVANVGILKPFGLGSRTFLL